MRIEKGEYWIKRYFVPSIFYNRIMSIDAECSVILVVFWKWYFGISRGELV